MKIEQNEVWSQFKVNKDLPEYVIVMAEDAEAAKEGMFR